jgi:hypothetical protein
MSNAETSALERKTVGVIDANLRTGLRRAVRSGYTIHRYRGPRGSSPWLPAEHLREKDWTDIAGVIRAARLDLDNPEFQAIIQRYGPLESNTELRRRL